MWLGRRSFSVSPVAWTHLNFYGRYTFSEDPAVVSIDSFVETMTQYPFQAQASEEIVER
jgi:hypothetical protein